MRLQKYLASCGVASRRAAEKLMAEGRVTVDGQVISHMGAQVEPGQDVRVDGRPALPEAEKCYIMYHKPAGEVTTVTDPEGRATVLDKFRDFPVRLYPVDTALNRVSLILREISCSQLHQFVQLLPVFFLLELYFLLLLTLILWRSR